MILWRSTEGPQENKQEPESQDRQDMLHIKHDGVCCAMVDAFPCFSVKVPWMTWHTVFVLRVYALTFVLLGVLFVSVVGYIFLVFENVVLGKPILHCGFSILSFFFPICVRSTFLKSYYQNQVKPKMVPFNIFSQNFFPFIRLSSSRGFGWDFIN